MRGPWIEKRLQRILAQSFKANGELTVHWQLAYIALKKSLSSFFIHLIKF